MSIFATHTQYRKWGRRTGGDRRHFSYAVYLPERRISERRKDNRRKTKAVFMIFDGTTLNAGTT